MIRPKSPSRIGDMTRNCACWGRLIAIVAACFAPLPVLGAGPLVSATIDPAQITVGQSARLTISRLGTDLEAVTLPVVPGLEFRIIERLQGREVIHGATLATTVIVVRVTPQVAGTFIIPEITPKSQPLVLRVDPDNGTGNSNVPGRAPIGAGGSTAAGIQTAADGSAFVRLSGAKREIYVGESVPITIEMGVRAGVVTSINGLPAVTGGDFTLLNLSRQPARTEKIIEGKPFTLFTWRSVLAAIRPGVFSVSVEAPVTVRVTTRSPRESLLEDQLGDPFLQYFYGATVPKDITVTSPKYELTAVALPTEGRPPSFSGAVGMFEISSDISPTAAAAGDPLTLRMHVSGSGNFDRVDSAMLEHLDQWKTYPPKSSFHSSDAIGYQGEKIFEQPVIASKSGAQTLPGLAFSYFDPTTHRYQTARSPPLRVMISPSLVDGTLATATLPARSTANPANPPLSGLRPDHPAAERFSDSLVPLYLQPRFLVIPSLLGLLFAGAWLAIRRSAPDADDTWLGGRGISKAAKRVLAQMEAAARSGDTALFLNEARSALLRTLPTERPTAPEQMKGRDADAGIDRDSEDIRQLFALADEAQYSGKTLESVDFARWMQIVRGRLMDERAR
jgi:hypothetical protein